MTNQKKITKKIGPWGYTIAAIVLMIVFLFPVYWMINVSLQSGGSASVTPLIPVEISFEGYKRAFVEQLPFLRTSLIIAIGSVVLSLLIATPGAYALARYRIPGSQLFILIILLTQMIPGIVVANALYGFYSDVGLLNSIPGLILADASLGVPFALLILHPFMKSIQPAILEAAEIDGAGPLRTFIQVVLPMSRNALVTAGLFSFLFAWGDFLYALTLTTNEAVRPVTLSLYTYLGAFVQDWSTVMATAVMASVPAILLLVVAQKYVSAGISAGAVK